MLLLAPIFLQNNTIGLPSKASKDLELRHPAYYYQKLLPPNLHLHEHPLSIPIHPHRSPPSWKQTWYHCPASRSRASWFVSACSFQCHAWCLCSSVGISIISLKTMRDAWHRIMSQRIWRELKGPIPKNIHKFSNHRLTVVHSHQHQMTSSIAAIKHTKIGYGGSSKGWYQIMMFLKMCLSLKWRLLNGCTPPSR